MRALPFAMAVACACTLWSTTAEAQEPANGAGLEELVDQLYDVVERVQSGADAEGARSADSHDAATDDGEEAAGPTRRRLRANAGVVPYAVTVVRLLQSGIELSEVMGIDAEERARAHRIAELLKLNFRTTGGGATMNVRYEF